MPDTTALARFIVAQWPAMRSGMRVLIRLYAAPSGQEIDRARQDIELRLFALLDALIVILRGRVGGGVLTQMEVTTRQLKAAITQANSLLKQS